MTTGSPKQRPATAARSERVPFPPRARYSLCDTSAAVRTSSRKIPSSLARHHGNSPERSGPPLPAPLSQHSAGRLPARAVTGGEARTGRGEDATGDFATGAVARPQHAREHWRIQLRGLGGTKYMGLKVGPNIKILHLLPCTAIGTMLNIKPFG